MRVEKLFQVLVALGAASTAGLVACGGDDDDGDGDGTGGQPGTGGGAATGGSTSSGGDTGAGGSATGGSSGDACEDACGPSSVTASWTDCNGCCCWLPAGATSSAGSPICGEEPCCEGRGR